MKKEMREKREWKIQQQATQIEFMLFFCEYCVCIAISYLSDSSCSAEHHKFEMGNEIH
jgi:hypothetical protein